MGATRFVESGLADREESLKLPVSLRFYNPPSQSKRLSSTF